VNGAAVAVSAAGRGWLLLDREWRAGDRVAVEFPMKIAVTRWTGNRDSVSVNRGPLTYSLKIGENWKPYGSAPWFAHEVFPTTPWNYALLPGEAGIRVAKEAKAVAGQPFTPEAAPIELKAQARRVVVWKQEANGMVGELPASPARTEAPVEEITLIPMGCARLRISVFPVAAR
jgi:hypothetical protein